MKYTNKFNLPDYARLWLEYDEYDYEKDVISATRLLSPVRQYAYYTWHSGELECDVSDVIASRYGTALHSSIELAPMPNTLKEKRFYSTVLGFKISGKSDIIKDLDKPVQTLIDVKSTSVWSYIYDTKDLDYIKQLSIYRFLANDNGMNIGLDAEIFMLFTDWSSKSAKKDSSYPQIRIAIKRIKLWTTAKTLDFIKSRLDLFKQVSNKEIDLPECTDEELWKPADKFTVMIPKRKFPIKLCNSYTDASDYIKTKYYKNASIKLRPGLARRCNYCLARKYCIQHKQLKEDGLIA